MKRWPTLALIILWFTTGSVGIATAGDERVLQSQAQEAELELIRKADAERDAADRDAAESRARITADRATLEKAIAELTSANQTLQNEVEKLNGQHNQLAEQEAQLTEELAQTDSMITELVGQIRINAKDLDALIAQNLQSALTEKHISFLEAVAQEERFPGMDDVRAMVRAMFDLMNAAGQVTRRRGRIINRSGREMEADILLIGPFTAAYRSEDEIGFCNYSSAGTQLYALSTLPPGRMQRQIAKYLNGKSEAVPMDISRGGALRQLTHELNLLQQIPKGGPIVWPILSILAVGLLIVAERTFFLIRRRTKAAGLMKRISELAMQGNWQACQDECAQHHTPVARVVAAGLSCCHMAREEMENALQEAILKEIPPMERFLSTLGMLAAIAPLLGLLGTVTGMIDTFHVITLHGTGDPRLMSGGISEALVTTMLGLSVAIPLMLAQTLLDRTVETRIGQMEEKAVALVNVVHKGKMAKDKSKKLKDES